MSSFAGSGQLILKPLEGKLTRDTEFLGSMDPYLAARLGGQTQKTKVHNDAGKFPKWHDTLVFHRSNETTLEIEVIDSDRTSDDTVGSASVALGPIFDRGKVVEWTSLSFKGKHAGTVLLEIEWLPDQKSNAGNSQGYSQQNNNQSSFYPPPQNQQSQPYNPYQASGVNYQQPQQPNQSQGFQSNQYPPQNQNQGYNQGQQNQQYPPQNQGYSNQGQNNQYPPQNNNNNNNQYPPQGQNNNNNNYPPQNNNNNQYPPQGQNYNNNNNQYPPQGQQNNNNQYPPQGQQNNNQGGYAYNPPQGQQNNSQYSYNPPK